MAGSIGLAIRASSAVYGPVYAPGTGLERSAASTVGGRWSIAERQGREAITIDSRPQRAGGQRAMRGHLRIGRIAGVEISLHYTWFVIAALITLSLVAQFRFANPEWSPAVVWTAAVVTGVLFFV